MHFTVQELSMYLLIVIPDASSLAESFLRFASPVTAKSAAVACEDDALPSSDQIRKPNELMRSLSRFSATGEFCEFPPSARTLIDTDIFGSPLLRMKLTRSSRDI